MRSRRVVIVGAGPAGLMAADVAAAAGASVLVIEAARTPGRKFLLAGRSGLNLSNTAPALLDAYGSDRSFLAPMLTAFGIEALTDWCASLGEPVVVGSSGRVFPGSWRAAPLLRAWLRALAERGVEIRTSCRWLGFDDRGCVRVDGPNGPTEFEADAVVLACGGGSWPRTGSDGRWALVLEELGVVIDELRPANAELLVHWSDSVLRHRGDVLKDIEVHGFGGHRVRGDLVIVDRGVQGTPAYTLASTVGAVEGPAVLAIDLRPDVSEGELARRLARRNRGESNAHVLRRFGFSPVAIAVANELRRAPGDPQALAAHLKSVPITVMGVASLDRAISTAGGVAWSSIDRHLSLIGHPNLFVAGEMIGWDAPTGGYLLHACLATGAWAGRHAAQAALN
jgi:uncharacterized flavoprotein (TIGR03862 family)